jgi:hypothetical protein
LQFPSEEYDTPDLQAFRQNMVDFENKIKADALVNSKAWFGKQHNSPEVLEALWTPILKYSKDKTTGDFDKTKAPTLKVKLQQYEGDWKTEVYDSSKKRLFPSEEHSSPVELIRKGTKIIALIQCTGLWFISGKFGVTWKLIQTVVPNEQTGQQGCLIEIDGVCGKASVPLAVAAVSESATLVEDSDDEEENDIPMEQPSVSEDDVDNVAGTENAENTPVVEAKKKRVVKRKEPTGPGGP